jgi:hypothetical protein
MVGSWEGTGTSPFGQFYTTWSAQRVGRWIVATQDIYQSEGGPAIEHLIHVYGINLQGQLTADTYDSTGKSESTGTATADSGAFHSEADGVIRDYSWTVSDNGNTLSGVFKLHNPNAKDPFPKDFQIEETDHRLPVT